jgi:hypothetical protein
VVGVALVEATEQGHVHGGRDAVRPLLVHDHREQVAVEVVHLVVGLLQGAGLLDVLVQDDPLGLPGEVDGHAAHLAEVRADLVGQHGVRVPAACGLGDVQRQVTHALEALRRVDGGEHRAEIGRDRGLQGKQRVRVLLARRTGVVDLGVVADHLFGQAEVGVQQCLGGELHGGRGHGAHVRQLFGKLAEFDLVGLTHGDSLRPRTHGNGIPG